MEHFFDFSKTWQRSLKNCTLLRMKIARGEHLGGSMKELIPWIPHNTKLSALLCKVLVAGGRNAPSSFLAQGLIRGPQAWPTGKILPGIQHNKVLSLKRLCKGPPRGSLFRCWIRGASIDRACNIVAYVNGVWISSESGWFRLKQW